MNHGVPCWLYILYFTIPKLYCTYQYRLYNKIEWYGITYHTYPYLIFIHTLPHHILLFYSTLLQSTLRYCTIYTFQNFQMIAFDKCSVYDRTSSPCVHILQYIICTHTIGVYKYTQYYVYPVCIVGRATSFLFGFSLPSILSVWSISHIGFLLWFVAAYYEPRPAIFKYIYIYSQKPLFNVQHLTTRVRKSSMTFESTWDPIIFIQYHLSFSVCWIHYPLNHPPKDQQPEVGNKMTCSQDFYHQQHQLCWISTGVMSTDLQSTWKRKHRRTGAIGSAKLQWDSSQHLTWEEQEKWHHVWELHT